MLSQVTLAEISRPSEDPRLALEAALLVFYEIGYTSNPGGEDLESQLADMEGRTTVVALDGRQVLATGALEVDESAAPATAHIMDLAVASDYRRLGLGRHVVNRIEGRAQEAGVNRLQVYSMPPSRGFYRQLGYQAIDHGDFVKYL